MYVKSFYFSATTRRKIPRDNSLELKTTLLRSELHLFKNNCFCWCWKERIFQWNMIKLKKNQIHFKIQTVRHGLKHLKIIWDYLTVQETVGKTRLCLNTGSKFWDSTVRLSQYHPSTANNWTRWKFPHSIFPFSLNYTKLDWLKNCRFIYVQNENSLEAATNKNYFSYCNLNFLTGKIKFLGTVQQ